MSIRRDHILKLIERAGPALKRVFGLRQAHKRGDLKEVRVACRELLDLDLGLVTTLPVESLRGLLTIDEGSGPGRCAVAAELLEGQAELLEPERPADAAELRRRAEALRVWVASQPGGRETLDAFANLRSGGPHPA